MNQLTINRRTLLAGAAAAASMIPFQRTAGALAAANTQQTPEKDMSTVSFIKTQPPEWLLAFWKEIDDKTFGMTRRSRRCGRPWRISSTWIRKTRLKSSAGKER